MTNKTSSMSMLRGMINGISREGYESLAEVYESLKAKDRIFITEVRWSDAEAGSIFVHLTVRHDKNYHIDDFDKEVFPKIAERIAEGKSGLLLFVGEELSDIAYIFFGHKKYEWRKASMEFPTWWREDLRRTAAWDKLFEL